MDGLSIFYQFTKCNSQLCFLPIRKTLVLHFSFILFLLKWKWNMAKSSAQLSLPMISNWKECYVSILAWFFKLLKLWCSFLMHKNITFILICYCTLYALNKSLRNFKSGHSTCYLFMSACCQGLLTGEKELSEVQSSGTEWECNSKF